MEQPPVALCFCSETDALTDGSLLKRGFFRYKAIRFSILDFRFSIPNNGPP
jgi:hypothetical protein